MPSKSQVDRAGAQLRAAGDPDSEELATFSAVIDEWRSSHAEPLRWVAGMVQNRLGQTAGGAALGQRLKRKPQIVSKLGRETLRLSQMQDVGGCRGILGASHEVDAVAARIQQYAGRHYQIVHESDYRADGRPATGYRALHLVALRDERHIEIQLRTFRQQAWAEAVERASNRSGHDLKAGDGPEEMIEFFRLCSDAFCGLDRGEVVPASVRRRIKELRPTVKAQLPDVSLKDRPRPARIRSQSFKTVMNNWLIVYDWRAARFVAWSDLGSDATSAAAEYGRFEERFPYEHGYEVVLVGADSTATLRRTHAHYFGKDPNDFDPLGYFAELGVE